MSDKPKQEATTAGYCTVKLDRLQFASPVKRLPSIPGFRTTADTFVRRRSKRAATYQRVRSMEKRETGTKLYIQYEPMHGWLKPIFATVVGNDATGIEWPDLKSLLPFGDYQIRMLEIAFDFAPESGIDLEFVRKHAVFGKSRPVANAKYPHLLRYGTRHSAKMVRCYWKPQINALRIELELHGTWVMLPRTEFLLYLLPLGEDDFRFARVDWPRLNSHLWAKGARGKEIAANARAQYQSLHGLLRYLRQAGVKNAHRFLKPLRKRNAEIDRALDAWCKSLSPRVRNRSLNDEQKED